MTACFRLGPPVAPPYNFDHGFLDREIGGQHFLDSSKRQPPTARDHELFGLWEAAALSALVLRRDLKDACLAYLHFLRGHGADYAFCYDRFLMDDGAGGRVLRSALEDTYVAAMAFGGELLAVDDSRWQLAFDLCSDAVIVGNTNNDRYPYPSTENWQKTVGGHTLWISASVEMRVDPVRSFAAFDVVATLHAADMYNFDPKKQDATTGIPDAANGRFEVTGLAHEFLQFGDAKRSARFEAPLAALGRRR